MFLYFYGSISPKIIMKAIHQSYWYRSYPNWKKKKKRSGFDVIVQGSCAEQYKELLVCFLDPHEVSGVCSRNCIFRRGSNDHWSQSWPRSPCLSALCLCGAMEEGGRSESVTDLFLRPLIGLPGSDLKAKWEKDDLWVRAQAKPSMSVCACVGRCMYTYAYIYALKTAPSTCHTRPFKFHICYLTAPTARTQLLIQSLSQ